MGLAAEAMATGFSVNICKDAALESKTAEFAESLPARASSAACSCWPDDPLCESEPLGEESVPAGEASGEVGATPFAAFVPESDFGVKLAPKANGPEPAAELTMLAEIGKAVVEPEGFVAAAFAPSAMELLAAALEFCARVLDGTGAGAPAAVIAARSAEVAAAFTANFFRPALPAVAPVAPSRLPEAGSALDPGFPFGAALGPSMARMIASAIVSEEVAE